jgi:integrase
MLQVIAARLPTSRWSLRRSRIYSRNLSRITGSLGVDHSHHLSRRLAAELDTSVFIIPEDSVKNGEERLVVLNRVAKSVVESQRGLHPTHVFARVPPPKGEARPLPKMYGTAWKQARERAANKWAERHGAPASEGFRKIRVHDLKHTYGRRLRAAGVSFEDRQDA